MILFIIFEINMDESTKMPDNSYINASSSCFKLGDLTVHTVVNPIQPQKANAACQKEIDKALKRFHKASVVEKSAKAQVFAIQLIQNNAPIAELYSSASENGNFSLDYLHVAEGMRRNGIGKHLYKMALKKALEWQKKTIELDTHEFQAAGFYEKLGFKRVAKIPNQVTEASDLVFFEKEISDSEIPVIEENPEYQYDVITTEYSHPAELYKKSMARIKQIYDRAVSGVMEYTVSYLHKQDGCERDLPDYAISIEDPETKELVGFASGCMNLGGPLGSYIRPYRLWVKEDKYLKDLSEAILDMGKKHQCTFFKVVSTSTSVLEKLGKMNLASRDLPTMVIDRISLTVPV